MRNSNMLILGIDPGIARCGWGVIRREGQVFECVDYGCIETPKGMDEGERLLMVSKGLTEVLSRFKIERVGLEKLFFSKNVSTAFQVGQARGVIVMTLHQAGLVPIECTPNEVKSAVAGYGAADKKQMQKMVCLSLKLAKIPEPDDAADALAIAMTVSGVQFH